MVFYIHSPGDTIRSSETNSNLNGIYKLDSEKAINDVSATNSGVLAVSSQVLIDKFLDADGQNNTVDTGNTTGNYVSTNLTYSCLGTGIDVVPQNANTTLASTGTSSGNNWQGYLIYVKTNCKLYSVTKISTCTAPNVRLYDATTNIIASATFVGNTATFSSPVSLSASTNYQILAGSNSSFNFAYTGSAPYPYNNAFINVTGGRGNPNSTSTNAWNITHINITDIPYVDSTIQSVATTIPSGKTKVFVTPLMYEALSTGDSITADVSIDNGSTYTTDVPINEWTEITSANGTQLVVKANLNTNDGTTTPKVKGWRVLLE